MTDGTTAGPGYEEDDALAAEYVLGVLEKDERDLCVARIAHDAEFAGRVADWEAKLSGMNHEFTEVQPPASLKAALDRRMFDDRPPATMRLRSGLWSSVGFWRLVSGTALAALAILVVLTIRAPTPTGPGETLVASLTSAETDAQFVALYDTERETFRITLTAGEKPANRDFELWLIARDKPPASMGLVGGSGDDAPGVATHLQAGFVEGSTLAVSIEPIGGSTTGAPTGPVIAVGQIKKI